MKRNKSKLLYFYGIVLLLLVYLTINLIVYSLSVESGYGGITIRLFGGNDDGFFYWDQAQNVSQGRDWIRTSIHAWVIGWIVRITNINNPIIARIFNFFGFILLVTSLVRLSNYLFKNEVHAIYKNRSKTMLVFFLLGYLSLQMNTNLSIYRDVWIYLFFVLSMFYSSKLLDRKSINPKNILMLAISLFLLSQYRRYAVVSILVGIILYWLYKRVKNVGRFIFVALILFGVYYTFFMDFNLPIANMSLSHVLNYRLSWIEYSGSGSQMNINLTASNYIVFLFNYIRSYISNFIGPLPWDINSLSTILVFFAETIPMVFLLSFLLKNRDLISAQEGYILFQSLLWIGMIAVSNDNIGTATRLRVNAWLLILVVFCSVYYKITTIKTLNKDY